MNLSITLRDRRTFKEYAGLFMIKTGAWIVVALFLASLGYICYHGAGTLSPSFLSSFPEKMMEEGGILPCIIGTAILSIGAMAVALPLGIVCAVWLNEYAKEGPLKKLITLAVANLAGVPSIVFGLFGLAFFVTVCGLGVSAIAGILTLAFSRFRSSSIPSEKHFLKYRTAGENPLLHWAPAKLRLFFVQFFRPHFREF